MPRSKFASKSPWKRSFRKLMPKSCLNLKTQWNRVCIRRMFPHLARSNVRRNPHMPLWSADSFHFAALSFCFCGPWQIVGLCWIPKLEAILCVLELCSSHPTCSSPQRKLCTEDKSFWSGAPAFHGQKILQRASLVSASPC